MLDDICDRLSAMLEEESNEFESFTWEEADCIDGVIQRDGDITDLLTRQTHERMNLCMRMYDTRIGGAVACEAAGLAVAKEQPLVVPKYLAWAFLAAMMCPSIARDGWTSYYRVV